ncbi:hypothetical protein [Pseudomonas fluorescens]|uniref:hypothetical protein n=1 Tax=Pseudomonas fluorescens TaxID=294 RepID=UPI00178171B7|nr:hypothetical protein [Pseudomonas fluorescens]
MNVTEVAVIKAAREYAAKNGQNDTKAVVVATDEIRNIRFRFTGDQYQQELEGLYQRYAQS